MAMKIVGVIVGYIVMAAFVFITFSLTYMVLGSEGSFQPGTYDVSMSWVIASILLGLIGAVLGGLVCSAISKSSGAVKVLMGVVLVLGLAIAVAEASGAGEAKETIRTGEVGMTDAMTNAHQPIWLAFLNPFIGAAGVYIGACMRSGPKGPSEMA